MGEMTLREALEEYQSVYLAARNYSKKTRADYGHDVLELVEFLDKAGVKRVGELGVPVLERYLADLDNRGVAGSTRKKKVVSVRSFLSFLYHNEYIAVNLAKRIIPPRSEYRNPRFLTEKEYKRLLDVCSHSKRDYAIIQLLLQTGMKLSELTRLKIDDLDLADSGGFVRIRGGRGKEDRMLPLNNKACLALKAYLLQREDSGNPTLFLNKFGQALGDRGVQKMIRKHIERARLENASVHTLRHTFGIHQAVKGTSLETLKEVMGHKDGRSTSLYLSMAKESVRKEILENAL
ncbi:MAG: tyrosine-type recombinase/integrase [Candidatus Bathyarchaeia archaeon]